MNMQNQLDNIGDDSKQNNTQIIQTLKQQITFTNAQLYQIVNNPDHFNQRIKNLNQKAIKEINQQKYQQAIIYLAEAEKNLEYAASCGLAINRVLINTILNNQACAYQRLWELGTCYDYVQALIYNLNIGGDNTKQLMLSEELLDTSSETSKKFNKLLNKKINLALSYLQFSALSSQLGKHDQALKLVQKSLTQFKDLCDICYSYQKNKKGKTSILLDQIRNNIQFNPKLKIYKILKQCKAGLQKIKNHRYFFTFDQKIIQKMSMGHIMQIEYRSLESAMKPIQTEWFTSQLGLTYIIIYISCCFFALATQIRLGTQKQIANSQTVQSHAKLAKIYHLHAINMASNLVLIQSNFLNHITKSFKNNFGIDIPSQNFDQQRDQFDQISQIIANQNERKDQKQRKAQQNQKFRKPLNKKNDGQITTKFQTIQSNYNSIADVKQKKSMLLNSKKQQRKVSIVQQKLSKKVSKKLLFEQFAADMKRSKTKNNKSIKLKSSINKQKKSISKNKNILNNEYFSKIQSKQKKKESHAKDVVSPRCKITRKTQQSRSKPKLLFTNIKSPKKM